MLSPALCATPTAIYHCPVSLFVLGLGDLLRNKANGDLLYSDHPADVGLSHTVPVRLILMNKTRCDLTDQDQTIKNHPPKNRDDCILFSTILQCHHACKHCD